MDNKSDLFDLKKEKQELDHFLSTISGTDAPVSKTAKESAPVKESAPAVEPTPAIEPRPAEKIPEPEPPKPRQLAQAPAPEDAFMQPAYHEKPAPGVAEEVKPEIKPEIKPVEEPDTKPRVTSSFLPSMDEKKEEPLSKIIIPREDKAPEPPQAFTGPDKFDTEIKSGAFAPEEEKIMTFDGDKEHKALEEALYEPPRAEKKTGRGKQIGLLVVLVIVLLAGGAWMFSGQVMNVIKAVPVIKNLVSAEKDVGLINVRTRLVDSKKTGKSLRVIEGIATNTSSQTISNIRIEARLQDAGGAELMATESFAGNILMDEKLENLDAGAIKAALQSAKGGQDKIPPKGQIPFMIVFAGEPVGVFKTSVTPVDFTKN